MSYFKNEYMEMTARGLVVYSQSFQPRHWQQVWDSAWGYHDASRWTLGDLWRWRDKVPDDIINEIRAARISLKTVQNYAWIAKNWPYNLRDPEVSFSHHSILAALDNDTKVKWLTIIKQHDLGTDDLRAALEGWDIQDHDRAVLIGPVNLVIRILDMGRRAIEGMPAIPEKDELESILDQLSRTLERLKKKMSKDEAA